MRFWMRAFCAIAVFCVLMVPSALFASASQPDIVPMLQGENAQQCGEFMQNRRFYFDESARFHWLSKYHSGVSKALGNIDAREGRFKVTTFGLPALLTGPVSLFGECDWWPRGLAVAFSIEQQVIMGHGEDSGDPWSVQMNLIGWGPALEFRYCSDKRAGYFFCGGLKHTHWSGGSGRLVNEASLRLQRYVLGHGIKTYLDEVNVVTLQFMHSFTTLGGAATVQYRIGRNLYNIPFDHFIERFGGFTDTAAQSPYPYPGVLEGKGSLHVTRLLDVAVTLKSEFSSDEVLYLVELSVDMFVSANRQWSFRLLYQHYGGMEDKALYMTQWGAWFSGAKSTGFALGAHGTF